MATMKLNSIADRQRTYLVRDLLFAAFVAVMLVFVISAFTTAGRAAVNEADGVIRVTATEGAAPSSRTTAIQAMLDRAATSDARLETDAHLAELCSSSPVC